MKKSLSTATPKQTEPEETSAPQISPAKTPKKTKYFEIKIPPISLKKIHTRDINSKTLLVISLIIFAFILGFLTNKIIYLENALNNKTANTSQNNVTPQAAQPGEPTPPPAKVDVSEGHLPPLGNPNAKVTIVEFSDFQCPFCQQFENNTYPQLYDEYIKTNKIKLVFRHYPLVGIHPTAQKAAEASECANDQDKFWEYHNILFKNQSTWSPLPLADALDSFTNYATELGLDSTTFRSCLDTDQFAQKVQEDISDGEKAYVNGTPTFFINGNRLVGAQPFDQLKQVIDQELK